APARLGAGMARAALPFPTARTVALIRTVSLRARPARLEPLRAGATRLEAVIGIARREARARPGRIARRFGGFDHHIRVIVHCLGDRRHEAARRRTGNLETGFPVKNADRADVSPGHMTMTAQERQQPARIGVAAAAHVDAEPGGILEVAAGRALPLLRHRAALLEQFFRLRQ